MFAPKPFPPFGSSSNPLFNNNQQSLFGAQTSNTASNSLSLFGNSTNTSTSLFGNNSTSLFGNTTTSLFGNTSAFGTTTQQTGLPPMKKRNIKKPVKKTVKKIYFGASPRVPPKNARMIAKPKKQLKSILKKAPLKISKTTLVKNVANNSATKSIRKTTIKVVPPAVKISNKRTRKHVRAPPAKKV